MKVWVVLTRKGGIGPVVSVLYSANAAHDRVEQVARDCGPVDDAGYDPASGRMMWFVHPDGEGNIDGPITVEV